MAYLDDTGLAYFWGKIKAWANSVFALLGHTHPSSDVTLMTGYSKPSASSAIAASDTLNQAVGKLEKGLETADGNAVHRTGNETVNGRKSFYGTSAPILSINSDFVEKGSSPATETFWGLYLSDKNGSEKNANTLGVLESSIEANGSSNTFLRVCKNIANSSYFYTIGVHWDSTNDLAFGYCPTPPANDNAAHIATTAWVRTFCSSFIPITQNISSLTKGTNPSSRVWYYSSICYDSAGTAVANRLMEHRAAIDDDGRSRNELLAYDFTSGSSDAVAIGIYKPKGGDGYATCPTPAAGDNSTKIATTAWVNSTITNAVITNSLTTSFIVLKNNNCNKGTAPSSTLYWQLYANDKNAVQYSNTIGIFEVSLTNANLSGAYMRAMENTAGSTNQSTLGVWYDKPGGATYVTCSTIRPTNTSCTCGTSTKKWGAVWATNGTIQTSDERVKTAIDIIPEEVLDVWEGVQWKQFKLKDSVKEKGSRARLHTGIIAQQIQREFEAKNIDAAQYGFFCWDEWGDSDAILDSDGNVVVEAIKADEQYSVRYDEALCIEAAYMRRENARLKKRVADLEDRLAALELRLGSE